jgi:hypothetical protein
MTSYRFPYAPRVVASLLVPYAATDRVGTRLPDSLAGRLPFVWVVGEGGPSGPVNSYARIRVTVLADAVSVAELLAERIHQFLTTERLALPPAVIDRVTVDSIPQEVAPWAPGVLRFDARYTCVSRRFRSG